MSAPVELMPREFAGSMPEMMAEFLRAVELLDRVRIEAPAVIGTPLGDEIGTLLDAVAGQRGAQPRPSQSKALSTTRLSR